jgi:hypothetical protein
MPAGCAGEPDAMAFCFSFNGIFDTGARTKQMPSAGVSCGSVTDSAVMKLTGLVGTRLTSALDCRRRPARDPWLPSVSGAGSGIQKATGSEHFRPAREFFARSAGKMGRARSSRDLQGRPSGRNDLLSASKGQHAQSFAPESDVYGRDRALKGLARSVSRAMLSRT